MNLRAIEPLLRRSAAKVLDATFDRGLVSQLIDDTFVEYDSQRATLPEEEAFGGQLMVHCAALTIGLYRALMSIGRPADEARELTGRVTASVYTTMSALPTQLSKLGSPTPRTRLKRATNLFRRFPFGPPSYEMVDVHQTDSVAFDVRRCPVAEYFISQDLGDLCVETWCNLDYALAERWGARLERTKTLAGGDTHCDFRWIPM